MQEFQDSQTSDKKNVSDENSLVKESPPQDTPARKHLTIILVFLILTGLFFATYLLIKSGRLSPFRKPPSQGPIAGEKKVEKFSSEADFKSYLEESQFTTGGFFGTAEGFGIGEAIEIEDSEAPSASLKQGAGISPQERVSETTVQVAGVDEPDVVKTDGASIFFSGGIVSYPRPVIMEESIGVPSPPYKGPETRVIKAFPPADLGVEAVINKTGNLLLSDKVLIIFSGNQILGYDISDSKTPAEKWKFELESKNQIVGSRLYKDKIYIVTQTKIVSGTPCPIPLTSKGTQISIDCAEIYHPVPIVPIDSTFTAFVINPKNGVMENKISFVGSSGSSILYMSENAIYITYSYSGSLLDFFYNFYSGSGKNLLPSSLIDKIEKLKDYDISEQSKFTELSLLLQNYYSLLSDDERLRIENETSNRLADYGKEHLRELESTGIVKVNIADIAVKAVGEVPGRPLNQFSLDEYQGNLRVATTVSSNWVAQAQSENDVYVLDGDLKVVGKVLGLGLTERIYSVRFIEDKGYLVTFRQTDPFYVLDLSSPENPQMKGQLKIPGYSAYLHPINKDKILGIGKEGSQVKISLFDTGNPENPSEISKYTLDEYWSDILNTHHAFLIDPKHNVFFLPGGKGGYIFSYKDDALSLVKAVSEIIAKRAVFIADYMYVIGEDKIRVLNEADWQEVNSLSF